MKNSTHIYALAYLVFILVFASGIGVVSAAVVYLNGNTSSNTFIDTVTGAISIGSSTPVATWQITVTGANATSTLELGKKGQTKGSCIKMYRYDGTGVYLSVNNSNALVVSASACLSGL